MNDVARLLELRDQLGGIHRALLTKAAQALALAADEPDSGCASCGAEIDQLALGRPRRYCTTCSPRKKAEKAKVDP